jgi:hypothetical protein
MRLKHCLILLLLCLTVVSAAQAQVDAQVVRTLQLKASPVDLVIPARGRYIYVLTSDAKLQIYKNNGELRDTVAVDPGVDRIQAGPGEDRLYLISSADHKIQELNLAFIHKIPVDGSPTKGSLDAAVAVVVFTDFQ